MIICKYTYTHTHYNKDDSDHHNKHDIYLSNCVRLTDGEAIYVAPVNMTALLLVAAGYIESSSYGGKFLDRGTGGCYFCH
jgi:hypothetical protein